MNSLSTTPVSTQQFELWLLVPGQYAEPLSDCGVYQSQRECGKVAGAVANWIALGVWDSLLNYLSPDAVDELLFIERGLTALAVDLTSVQVIVREFASGHDNRDSTKSANWMTGSDPDDDDDGDDDLDDDDSSDDLTPLELPEIVYLPAEK